MKRSSNDKKSKDLEAVRLDNKGPIRSLDSDEPLPSYRMRRTTALSGIIFLGILIALLFHYGVGSIQGAGWPMNSFLYDPKDRFGDFVNSVLCVKDWNPYHNNTGKTGAYFPFAYLCLWPFTTLPMQVAVWCFFLFTVLSFSLLIVWWCSMRYAPGEKCLAARDLAISFAASYPFLFALDRGNLDTWIGTLVLLFLIGLRKGKWGIWLAVPALAAAAALKGYPALFVLLLIVERRYIAALAVVGATTLLTFGSLSLFNGDIMYNWSGFRAGLKFFHEQYVVGTGSLHYFADPYNGIRLWTGTTDSVKNACGGFSFIFLLMSSFFVLFSPVPIWRKTMAIGITLLIFPLVANDYKLLVLVPGALELLALNEPMSFREKAVLVLTALLFIPKHYYFFKGSVVSVSCIASPIFVVLIAAALLVDLPAWRAAFSGFRETFAYYWEPLLIPFRRNTVRRAD